ncbi:MAG: NAD(P)H-hydrate dehydratase [Nitrospiraceae bacterium]|nr:MAG: NAD(P)H-hydrate dehydratase [Nitrospiraceae bacterium]
MIKVVTAKEMQTIDRTTIHAFGLPGTTLMERAGLSVVQKINELYPLKKVAVLCGGGNNGGDGFVIARELLNQGRAVNVFMLASPARLKGDAKLNYSVAKKFGVPLLPISKFLPSRHTAHSLIVDALLGTGLSKNVKPPLAQVIKKINRLSCPVVSVDIPSGISSDTGQVMGCAVRADCTVTFGLPKRGHMLHPGAEYSGRLIIEDIGFPRNLTVSDKIRTNVIEPVDAARLLPPRPVQSHKGTKGHVLIVAGSRGKTGAALMAARSCLQSGAGLVTIGIPERLVSSFQSRVTEEMILPLPDRSDGTLSFSALDTINAFLKKKVNVLAMGPGLSASRDISTIVREIILSAKIPVVIDADGLNVLSGNTALLKKAKAPRILTPHAGEMARLIHRDTDSRTQNTDSMRKRVEEERISTAVSFAKTTNTCLVLKGVPTITAMPGGEAYINSSGNPGMATAGTGDVLTGMISAFLAQGLPPQHAAILGVYIHGYAGDRSARRKGQFSVVASDIIREIPRAFKSLQSID